MFGKISAQYLQFAVENDEIGVISECFSDHFPAELPLNAEGFNGSLPAGKQGVGACRCLATGSWCLCGVLCDD